MARLGVVCPDSDSRSNSGSWRRNSASSPSRVAEEWRRTKRTRRGGDEGGLEAVAPKESRAGTPSLDKCSDAAEGRRAVRLPLTLGSGSLGERLWAGIGGAESATGSASEFFAARAQAK